jgi:hypothetical protein
MSGGGRGQGRTTQITQTTLTVQMEGFVNPRRLDLYIMQQPPGIQSTYTTSGHARHLRAYEVIHNAGGTGTGRGPYSGHHRYFDHQ